MESSTEVTAVIPLLFLVVTQISSAGREMDLVEVAGEHNPFVFSFLPDRVFPNMGRFNFIHGTNMVVLIVAVVTSAGLTSGLQSRLLVAVSITLWIVTPALEVDEYDQILDEFSDDEDDEDDEDKQDKRDKQDKGDKEDCDEDDEDCDRSFHSFHVHIVCVLLYGAGLTIGSERYLELSADGSVVWGQLWPVVVAAVVVGSAYYLVYMHLLREELEEVEEPQWLSSIYGP